MLTSVPLEPSVPLPRVCEPPETRNEEGACEKGLIAHLVLRAARTIGVEVDAMRSRITRNPTTGFVDVSIVVNQVSKTTEDASMLKSSLLSCLLEDLSEFRVCIVIHVPHSLETVGSGSAPFSLRDSQTSDDVLAHVREQRQATVALCEQAILLTVRHNLCLVIEGYPWRDARAMSSLIDPMAFKSLTAFREEGKLPTDEDMDSILRPMANVLFSQDDREAVMDDCRSFAGKDEIPTLLEVYTIVFRLCSSSFARTRQTHFLYESLFTL